MYFFRNSAKTGTHFAMKFNSINDAYRIVLIIKIKRLFIQIDQLSSCFKEHPAY